MYIYVMDTESSVQKEVFDTTVIQDKKRRGRKPKQEDRSSIGHQQLEDKTKEDKKKRGRRPKSVYAAVDNQQNTTTSTSLSDDENVIVRLHVQEYNQSLEDATNNPLAYNTGHHRYQEYEGVHGFHGFHECQEVHTAHTQIGAYTQDSHVLQPVDSVSDFGVSGNMCDTVDEMEQFQTKSGTTLKIVMNGLQIHPFIATGVVIDSIMHLMEFL